MKSAIETLNPTRVKLSVEVPFDEFKPSLDAAYRRISQQVTVPGFRRGKVPTAIIDQRVGRDNVLVEAINEALPGIYDQALQENNITPLSSPELQVDTVQDGTDVAFTAELDIKPAISLPEFHGLEAEVDTLTVTAEDVDEQVDALRARFATVTAVDRPAEQGDLVTMDLSAAKNGVSIDEAQADELTYQIGAGTMLDGLDEALVGMSAGEERTFTSALVGGTLEGQEVDITVKVTAVKEQELPELDEEFVQSASEFDTVDELRADIREQTIRASRLDQAGAARDAVLARLLELVDVPLPEALVEEEKANRRQSLVRQLSQMGSSLSEYLESAGQTPDEYETELDTRVRNAITATFVLDDIAAVEQIEVGQEELTYQLIRRAQEQGVRPDDYIKHALDHDHLPELIGEVRRNKALGHLVATAVVKDKDGNVVELATLQPDGTYAEPSDAADDEQAPAVAGAAPGHIGGADAASDIIVSGDFVSLEDPTS